MTYELHTIHFSFVTGARVERWKAFHENYVCIYMAFTIEARVRSTLTQFIQKEVKFKIHLNTKASIRYQVLPDGTYEGTCEWVSVIVKTLDYCN